MNLGVRSALAAKSGPEEKGKSHEDKSQGNDQRGNQHDDKAKGNNNTGGDSEKSDNSQSPTQQSPQNLSSPPLAENNRETADSIATTDTLGPISANYPRALSDTVGFGDGRQLSLKKTSAPISLGSEIKITDQISTSGIATIPAVPRITVTSPPLLQVSSDQQGEITFDSTAAGTYSITITSDSGAHISQTLSGEMQVGANSVAWDGKKESGVLVPAGQYTYSITATAKGGVRQPPQQGDGSILVLGPTQTSDITIPLLEPSISLLIIVTIAAAGGILLLARARRKSLTLYLPAEATSIVADVRETYPQAIVEDYFEPTPNGTKRYVGITIPDPKDGNEEWQSEIAENVRAIAGVDPIKLGTKGKVHVL